MTNETGYENAPATKMLATNCACCARPLLDAVSVEIGIGPVCREKHGYSAAINEENRAEANKLVHDIAVKQGGLSVLHQADKLRALGFTTLADIIVKRCAAIRISEDADGRLAVVTPYSDDAVAMWRTVPGRRWDKERKVNTIPATSREALWKLLQHCYYGQIGHGPRGGFVVG